MKHHEDQVEPTLIILTQFFETTTSQKQVLLCASFEIEYKDCVFTRLNLILNSLIFSYIESLARNSSNTWK